MESPIDGTLTTMTKDIYLEWNNQNFVFFFFSQKKWPNDNSMTCKSQKLRQNEKIHVTNSGIIAFVKGLRRTNQRSWLTTARCNVRRWTQCWASREQSCTTCIDQTQRIRRFESTWARWAERTTTHTTCQTWKHVFVFSFFLWKKSLKVSASRVVLKTVFGLKHFLVFVLFWNKRKKELVCHV